MVKPRVKHEDELHANNLEMIGGWRQRAVRAYEFVKGESSLIVKSLELGLQQIEGLPVGGIEPDWVLSGT